MRVITDDEVYRVDAVWLGPPQVTMFFRARYVAWGVGIATWPLVFAVMRQLGFDVGVFSLAWSLLITVGLTRWICTRITAERPLGAVATLLAAEITAPRRIPPARGGTADLATVRIRADRPRPHKPAPERRRGRFARRSRT